MNGKAVHSRHSGISKPVLSLSKGVNKGQERTFTCVSLIMDWTGIGLRVRKWIWMVLLALFFLSISLFPVKHLEIRDRKESRVIVSKRVSEGQIVTFSYIHSVNRFSVVGLLRIEGRALRPIETRFPSFAVGLPNTSARITGNGEKRILTSEGGSVEMERFSFYVDRSTHPVVSIGGEAIVLEEWVRDGGIVDIRVLRLPWIYAFFNKAATGL